MDWTRDRLLATAVLLLAPGCQQMVSLGSECTSTTRECLLFGDGGSDANGWIPLPEDDDGDGGRQPKDTLDAALDSGALFHTLEIQNQSFERPGGLSGDVLLNNLVTELVPVPPVDYVFVTLPHWYTCIPFSVFSRSWSPEADAGIAANDLGDYLSFVVNASTVRQTLPMPLAVATSYSFEMKVISRSEGRNNLFVQVSGGEGGCGVGAPLGRSARLEDTDGWVTTCVTFMADRPYKQLLLAPGHEGPEKPLTDRLLLDELRQVASCDSLQ